MHLVSAVRLKSRRWMIRGLRTYAVLRPLRTRTTRRALVVREPERVADRERLSWSARVAARAVRGQRRAPPHADRRPLTARPCNLRGAGNSERAARARSG